MSRLLVIGNAGLDISLPVPRLPLPGETLVGGARATAPGGKGLNQAVVAQRTGLVDVGFLAPLGQDADAELVEAALRREGFASLDLPRLPGGTDLSLLMVLPDGENSIVTSGACAASLRPEDAARAAAGLSGGWLLLQGNLTAAATQAAAQSARAAGASVMLNPAPLTWDARPLLPACSVVVANAGEAHGLTGLSGQDAALALRAAGAAMAIVTLGAAGCVIADAEGVRHRPAPAVRVVDSTGAGDTFCGVLCAMLAAGRAMQPAIAAAQAAAALTVQRPGAFASLPSAAELA